MVGGKRLSKSSLGEEEFDENALDPEENAIVMKVYTKREKEVAALLNMSQYVKDNCFMHFQVRAWAKLAVRFVSCTFRRSAWANVGGILVYNG